MINIEKLLKLNKEDLETDISIAKLNGPTEYDAELKELMKRYDEYDKAILKEIDVLVMRIGLKDFYELGVFDGKEIEKGPLQQLFKDRNKVELDIKTTIFKMSNIEKPIKEVSPYEAKLREFMNSLTVVQLKQYIKYIGGTVMEKAGMINSILADPKAGKIAQLAYIELAKKGNVKFSDFYDTSIKIKNSAAGFGESDYDGLYGDEILKIMKPYKGFLGVIMNDEIPDLIEDSLHYDRFGFVINKDNSDLEGSHWCAIFVDIPDGSIEYFDSFGDEPTPEVTKDMMELIKEHDINYLMKFKVNGTKVQDLRTGSCGWFAMKFLIDRFNNVPFATASGYTIKSIGSKKGESKVNVMKKSFGYI